MQLGANLAGKAIDISKTIAPHAISYPFTSMYGVPHGHAVSLSLNQILKFNYFNQNKILRRTTKNRKSGQFNGRPGDSWF